ncbi:hypothetical protein ACSBR2_018826 [Camellia fascicularis]
MKVSRNIDIVYGGGRVGLVGLISQAVIIGGGWHKSCQNYEEKIKNFFEEDLHIDEEIRYHVAGNGYFDVRDRNDAWICVLVKKGGMIILPAGIYHRFILDSNNYLKKRVC